MGSQDDGHRKSMQIPTMTKTRQETGGRMRRKRREQEMRLQERTTPSFSCPVCRESSREISRRRREGSRLSISGY